MSKDSISLTVPLSYVALNAAATMLQGLAEDMAPQVVSGSTPEPKKVLTEADANADLAGEPRPDNPSPEATAIQEQEAKEIFAAPAATIPPSPPAAPVAPTTDMDLDANGLPWDERIHASSKTQDVKGNWKYKRGVDRDVLVPQVEAELRESMGAIPEPETGAGNVPPNPAEAATPPPPAVTNVTPSTSVTTFAQLVTGITANSIPEDKVSAALAAVGLQNFALLGARPDLIPEVAGQLGL